MVLLHTQQSTALTSSKKSRDYMVMLPIPKHGIGELMAEHPNEAISLAVVVCVTDRGLVTRPAKKVLAVRYEKSALSYEVGGDFALPQSTFSRKSSQFEVLTAMFRDELGAPDSAIADAKASHRLLGHHTHSIPADRGEVRRSYSGKKKPKLLIFAKVCVRDEFEVKGAGIEGYCWENDLSTVDVSFQNMRHELKYFAELHAIRKATGWIG